MKQGENLDYNIVTTLSQVKLHWLSRDLALYNKNYKIICCSKIHYLLKIRNPVIIVLQVPIPFANPKQNINSFTSTNTSCRQNPINHSKFRAGQLNFTQKGKQVHVRQCIDGTLQSPNRHWTPSDGFLCSGFHLKFGTISKQFI